MKTFDFIKILTYFCYVLLLASGLLCVYVGECVYK